MLVEKRSEEKKKHACMRWDGGTSSITLYYRPATTPSLDTNRCKMAFIQKKVEIEMEPTLF
jgi:hypothetical protein